MKKFFAVIFIIIAMAIPAFAVDKSIPIAKTPIDGFRGIKWGDRVSKYPGEFRLSDTLPFINDSDYRVYNYDTSRDYMAGEKIGKFDYHFNSNYGFYEADTIIFAYYSKDSPIYKWLEEPSYGAVSFADAERKFKKIYNACVKQWGEPKKEYVKEGMYVYKWRTPLRNKKPCKDFLADDQAIAELKYCRKDYECRADLVIYAEKEYKRKFEKEREAIHRSISDF